KLVTVQPRPILSRRRQTLIGKRSQNLMQRLSLKLPPRFVAQTRQLFARPATAEFVLRLYVDTKPLAKRLMDLPPVNGADVVAVRAHRVLTRERPVAVRECEPGRAS